MREEIAVANKRSHLFSIFGHFYGYYDDDFSLYMRIFSFWVSQMNWMMVIMWTSKKWTYRPSLDSAKLNSLSNSK